MISALTVNLSTQEGTDLSRRRGQRKGYLYRRGPSWFLQYRIDTPELDERGKFKRATVTKFVAPAAGPGKKTKKQAERIAWEEYLAKLDQMSTRPQSMKTIAEFVKERFEPDVVWSLKPSGKAHYHNMLKNHVLPALGEFRLRDVRPQHVQDLVRAKLERGLSVQTAVHVRNAVSAIFRHAKRLQAYAGDLPTEGVRLPELAPAERRALTWEQVKLLAQFIGSRPCDVVVASNAPARRMGRAGEQRPDLEALVIVLALTGLRIGEAMGLKWRRVNLEGKHVVMDGELLPEYTLAVRENFVHGGYGTLKARTSRRNIPLTTEAWYQFSRLKMASKFAGPDDPVWAASNGKPLDRHNLSNRQLKAAAKAAGLSWASFHNLRHTSSTLADQAGLSVAERQRILGHATAEQTLHYTHAELEVVRGRMERIGKETVQ